MPDGAQLILEIRSADTISDESVRCDVSLAEVGRLVRVDTARARTPLPRLVSGGVLLLGDYGHWAGALRPSTSTSTASTRSRC